MASDTQCLILAAGRGERWEQHLGIPKQLISIAGETLLDRSIRLARKSGCEPVTIVTHDPRLIRPDCERIIPRRRRWIKSVAADPAIGKTLTANKPATTIKSPSRETLQWAHRLVWWSPSAP